MKTYSTVIPHPKSIRIATITNIVVSFSAGRFRNRSFDDSNMAEKESNIRSSNSPTVSPVTCPGKFGPG